MIIYCSQCETNWAKLWSQDVDDESYEVCPVCHTDHHLEAGNDIVGYIKCPFTGRVINSVTGVERIFERKEYVKPVVRVVVGKPQRETWEEREARELRAIDAYTSSSDPTEYFKAIKK